MRRRVLSVILIALFVLVPSVAAAEDTVGLVDPNSGLWNLRDASGGTFSFYFGNPGDLPFTGDWNCDGTDTPGLYRQSDGYVYLRNSNTQGPADISFFFGNPGDLPLAGDFDGDLCDTVSIYRPSESRVFVMNELGDGDQGLGAAETDYFFGNPGDAPFTGDFDGDTIDTVGLYRETTGFVYYRNTHTQGNADFEFFFGDPGDKFVGGDWTDSGADTPGVFRPVDSTFYLKYTNTQGNADEQFRYGDASMLPIAGTWGDIPAIPQLALDPVATGLSSPMVAVAPDGDDRLFIAERAGVIKVLKGGAVNTTPFLTVGGVSTCGEGGLLGMAFHPDYATNGRFFVHMTSASTGPFQSRIVEYHATPSSDVADAVPVQTILSLNQPQCNHNAGSISFGLDGYLYIPFGDGGKQGDPDGNAQNPFSWLGAVLRIDIDGGTPYAIPAGNPYDGTNGAPEVWANGLRNPFRSSIDTLTGDLYVGDVGQNSWEEVSVAPFGVPAVNFGWNVTEGNSCYLISGCDTTGLTLPVVTYPNPSEGQSVVGGYVYRGSAIPTLNGTYFYADFYSTWVRSFQLDGGTATQQRDWTDEFGPISSISGFGQDGHGELYIVTFGGSVYRIVAGS